MTIARIATSLLPLLLACSAAPLPPTRVGGSPEPAASADSGDGVVSAQSAEECATVCFGQASCEAWDFQAVDGTCLLQSGRSRRNTTPGSQAAIHPRAAR